MSHSGRSIELDAAQAMGDLKDDIFDERTIAHSGVLARPQTGINNLYRYLPKRSGTEYRFVGPPKSRVLR